MRSRWASWLILAVIPLLAGSALALVMRDERIPDPLLQIQAELRAGTIALLLGLLLTFAILEGGLIWYYAQRRRERALAVRQQEADEERRRFIRRLDHELKNPLTAIYAGLAELQADGDAPSATALQGPRSQVERLGRLMSALRKLTDLETRGIEHLPVDVSALLAEVTDAIKELPEWQGRQADLAVKKPNEPLPSVQGDRDLLWILLYNLLDNALKYTDPGCAITVRALTDNRHVVIQVVDAGPGIPEPDRPHVFEDLYRGSNARQVEGSGIGLAVVATIAARHGGTARVESRTGAGTTFTVRLPAATSWPPIHTPNTYCYTAATPRYTAATPLLPPLGRLDPVGRDGPLNAPARAVDGAGSSSPSPTPSATASVFKGPPR